MKDFIFIPMDSMRMDSMRMDIMRTILLRESIYRPDQVVKNENYDTMARSGQPEEVKEKEGTSLKKRMRELSAPQLALHASTPILNKIASLESHPLNTF